MGAVVPAVSAGLGAIGTISSISSQQRQASAQRAQIEANRIAAQDQVRLTKQRLAYSQDAATQTYLRERAILDQQRDTALQNFQLATLQQTAANIQEDVQAKQMQVGLEGQVQQMLGAASNVETQASQANKQLLDELAVRAFGDRLQANEFMQRLALTNQSPEAFNAIAQQSLLNSIARQQGVGETIGTTNRVSGAQAEAYRSGASVTQQYGELVGGFLETQRNANRQFQEFTQNQMPNLLELQAQRNLKAAEAASYAKQAELQIASQANLQNFANQERIAQAQMAGIQGPNILGAFAQLGQQLSPMIATSIANNQMANQGGTQFSPNFTFQSTNRQFTQPNTQLVAPGNLDFNRGVYTDVTGNVFG